MVRVMISYASPDRGMAESLKEFLGQKCKATTLDEVRVVEREAGAVQELPTRVMDEIENADVFITFYTEKGRSSPSPWLNQELGYAFKLLREGRLQILSVWEGTRHEVERGFLSSSWVHIDDRFHLGTDEKVFANIARYLEGEYAPPVLFDWSWLGVGGGPFLAVRIETRFAKPVLDSTINFVMPKGWKMGVGYVRTVPPVEIHDLIPGDGLPLAMRDSFEAHGSDVDRYSLPLQKLVGMESHELRFRLLPPRENEGVHLGMYVTKFGAYVHIPVHGTRLFQAKATCLWMRGGFDKFKGEIRDITRRKIQVEARKVRD